MFTFRDYKPPMAMDCGPFFAEGGEEISIETAMTLRSTGGKYYRLLPLCIHTAIQAVMDIHAEGSPVSAPGTDETQLMEFLHAEAEKMDAGSKKVARHWKPRSRELRLYGSNFGGIGKDADGNAWVEFAFVDYSYRGPLR
jgi:hypothetical protein